MVRRLIDVRQALQRLPHFETFPTVRELHELAERLRGDSRFDVRVAGETAGGLPVHHVRFGSGSVKALLVAGPQAMEPVGGLTVYGLMTLFEQDDPALVGADVEWNVVPCIDPDAALLNEDWYTRPYSLASYLRGFYMQPRPEQVDFSFPIAYKRLAFDVPSVEAQVLRQIIDDLRPDFYFTLHNYGLPAGGTWFALSRDIGAEHYEAVYELLREQGVTLQPQTVAGLTQFSAGMRELPTIRKWYDRLEEQGVPIPEEMLGGKLGASSHEHVLDLRPDSLVFVVEIPYGTHPGEASDDDTGESLRRLKLRIDADNKFLATAILEEWENTRADLDEASPFYRKIHAELVDAKDTLHIGVTEWYARPIQELLFSPMYAGTAKESDRIAAFMLPRALFLCNAYVFVRLLKASPQTDAVRRAIERLEALFDEALEQLDAELDLPALRVYDCDTLARVQLGCGLIAVNSLLAG